MYSFCIKKYLKKKNKKLIYLFFYFLFFILLFVRDCKMTTYIIMNNNFVSKSVSLSSIPIYDPVNQNYYNALCLNTLPEGNLQYITVPLNRNTYSIKNEYNKSYNITCGRGCKPLFVLKKVCGSRCDTFMTPEDIPDLMSFLDNNNYEVDTQLSMVFNTSKVRLGTGNIIMQIKYRPNK